MMVKITCDSICETWHWAFLNCLCWFCAINQWRLVLRSRILIVLSIILGASPHFRPSLEARRVTEEVYLKHFIWVSRISRTWLVQAVKRRATLAEGCARAYAKAQRHKEDEILGEGDTYVCTPISIYTSCHIVNIICLSKDRCKVVYISIWHHVNKRSHLVIDLTDFLFLLIFIS